MTDDVRNRWIGGVCTVVVHVVVLCVLLYVAMGEEPVVVDAGGGVLVQFGSVDEATGMFEPDNGFVGGATKADAADDLLLTQDEEQTVAVARQEQTEKGGKDTDKAELQEDNRIDDRLKNAFGKAGAVSGGKGSGSTGGGVQGSVFGTTSEGALQGVGGYGGYDLGGRGLSGVLPRPEYDNSNDAGTIVVDITVDNKGRVVNARVRVSGSEGSAASNLNLRESAVEAARRATFESVPTAGNQQGYIVYYFRQR